MLTVRLQQHTFSTHEQVFLWKCQNFWDRKCLDLRGTPPTFGFMPNALAIWAIGARRLLFHVVEHWLWRYRYLWSKINIWHVGWVHRDKGQIGRGPFDVLFYAIILWCKMKHRASKIRIIASAFSQFNSQFLCLQFSTQLNVMVVCDRFHFTGKEFLVHPNGHWFRFVFAGINLVDLSHINLYSLPKKL